MIDRKIVKEMLKEAKKPSHDACKNIYFAEDRWFWVGYKATFLISDVIKDNTITHLLNGKCIQIHPDIQGSLETLHFTESQVKKYEVTNNPLYLQIQYILDLFKRYTMKDPSELDTTKESASTYYYVLKKACECFTLFQEKEKDKTAQIYTVNDAIVIKDNTKYMIIVSPR